MEHRQWRQATQNRLQSELKSRLGPETTLLAPSNLSVLWGGALWCASGSGILRGSRDTCLWRHSASTCTYPMNYRHGDQHHHSNIRLQYMHERLKYRKTRTTPSRLTIGLITLQLLQPQELRDWTLSATCWGTTLRSTCDGSGDQSCNCPQVSRSAAGSHMLPQIWATKYLSAVNKPRLYLAHPHRSFIPGHPTIQSCLPSLRGPIARGTAAWRHMRQGTTKGANTRIP